MNIDIDYTQFRNWLESTLKPAGIFLQGNNNNNIGENYSDSGIEVIGEKNVVNKNISNWLVVKGNSNEVIDNRIIKNLQKFSRQDLVQLLGCLNKPRTNQAPIKEILKRLFKGVSIKGGISLINIPGLPSIYIEIEKQLTE